MRTRSALTWMRVACGVARGALGLLALGCVAENAGYKEVRDLTSARLGKTARWHAQEAKPDSASQTQKLLAAPLTPDSAVVLGLANNQAVQASFEKLGIARGEWTRALGLPNPSVGAALRWDSSGQANVDIDATLSLTELLLMPWRSGAAAARLDAAELEVVADIAAFAFETRVRFFAYQSATQQAELRKSVLAAAEASRELAERLHRAGNVTDLNLASQRALFEEARIAALRADARHRAAREELNAEMGLTGEQAAHWTLAPRLPDPLPVTGLLAGLEQRAVERSLDLELFRRRFREASRRATVARLQGWVPDLRAGVSAQRDDAGWGVGPRAELDLPLFYQGQGQTAVAVAEMRRQRNLFADHDANLRARSRALASLLGETAASVGYYRATLMPLREEIVQQTQLEYNAMSVGVFQLLQAKRDQILTAEAYVDLLREYWTLRAEVETLLAGVLPRRASTGAESAPTLTSRPEMSGGH